MSGLPEELLQDAVFDGHGAFTLAAEKAREKMRRFQLENPRRYLLQMVAALVASGATYIDITTEVRQVQDLKGTELLTKLNTYLLTVEFDGPGYTGEDLEGLYDAIFMPGDGPAKDRLRDLALGVLACQGLPARSLEIHSNGVRWLWEGGATSLEPQGEPQGQRIAVTGVGSPTETNLVREECLAVPIPLRLDGHLLTTPHRRWSGSAPWPAWTFKVPGAEGVVGLPYRDLEASRVRLHRYGVHFATRSLPELRPPVSVAIEASRLRKNVSQTDVVEDEAWRDLVAALPGILTDLTRSLGTKAIPAYHQEVVQSFLLESLAEWLPPELVYQPLVEWPEDLAPLAMVRLFSDRSGRKLSLVDLLLQAARDGFLCTTTRRLPYADLGDWLLLNPSPEQRGVLERYFRLVDVDGVLPDILGAGDPSTEARKSLAAGPPPLPVQPLAQFRAGEALLVVDDRVPNGVCRVRGRAGGCEDFPWQGLSVDLEFPEADARRAGAALEAHGRSLFLQLQVNLAKEAGLRRTRGREHLLTWWRRLLTPALGPVPPEALAERVDLCRRHLGEEAWNALLFETRAGDRVSLGDLASWIAEGGTLTVALGGPRRPGDHSLDGSPAQLGFLSQVFGAEALVRAKLREATQDGPSRRQEGSPEAAPASPSLPTRQEAPPSPATAEPRPSPPPAPVPVVAAPAEEAPATPAAALSGPGPVEGAPGSPKPKARRAFPGAPVEPLEPGEPVFPDLPEPAPVGLLGEAWEEWRREVPDRPSLASHAFTEGPLSGYLAVRTDPDDLVVLRGSSPQPQASLLGRTLVGWVQTPPSEEDGWSSEEEALLEGQLEVLYDRLAEAMALLGPSHPGFEVGRSRLLQHLLACSPSRLHQRLRAEGLADPLIRLRFLPLAGGGMASLSDLWRELERLGYLSVCPEESQGAAFDRPVPLVGQEVPEAFYEAVFLTTERVQPDPAADPETRLLQAAVRQLRQARARGDQRLLERYLDRIEWTECGRDLVVHEAKSGITRVNRAHRAVRLLCQRFQEEPGVAGLLASALYSAVNRALEAVRDEDEIRFLSSMLDVVDGQG